MAQSLKLPIALALALVAMLTTVGCNRNRADDSVQARDSSRSLPPGSPGMPSAGAGFNNPNWSAQTGQIFSNGGSLKTEALHLLTPPLDPQDIGEVSSNGITFTGIVRFSNGNTVNTSQSGIEIRVTDSYQQEFGAIEAISMRASGGTYNQDASQVDVSFDDQYGRLTLRGVLNGQTRMYEGEATYFNRGSNQNRSLGRFRVPTCGFFVC